MKVSQRAGTLPLSAEVVAELAPSMPLDRYAAGETLVRAAERPADLSIVTAGQAALTIAFGTSSPSGSHRSP